eukprot:5264400-Amphidinium_carterae.2
MCLNRWYATDGCLVTILPALDTAQAISGRLLRASQLSEPATPARLRPFLTVFPQRTPILQLVDRDTTFWLVAATLLLKNSLCSPSSCPGTVSERRIVLGSSGPANST